MQARRDDFIARLVATTEAEISQLEHDAPLRGLLEASLTENIVTAVHVLINGIDPQTVDAPASAVSYARRLAQRDVPLSALLRAYRLGHAQSLDLVLGEAVRLELPDPAGTVIKLVSLTSAFLDRVCDQIGRVYEEERERWVGSRRVLRQYWVNQLLDNPRIDLRQAEAALDYRLSGSHVAVEGWCCGTTEITDPAAVFDPLTSLLYTVLHAQGRPLLIHTDEADARIWPAVRLDCPADPDTVATKCSTPRYRCGSPSASSARDSTASAAAPVPPPAQRHSPSPPDRALPAWSPSPASPLSPSWRTSPANWPTSSTTPSATLRSVIPAANSFARRSASSSPPIAATPPPRTNWWVHRNTVHYRVQRAVDHYQSVPSATPTRGWYAPRR
ncbi:hypothetical protein [Streptomyces sp. NPDC005890]|uniref:hypothetical protein n=1 Tax=Streptomyces sp. NPDC005890 TaxID=3154568 RepID=UPI0033E90897